MNSVCTIFPCEVFLTRKFQNSLINSAFLLPFITSIRSHSSFTGEIWFIQLVTCMGRCHTWADFKWKQLMASLQLRLYEVDTQMCLNKSLISPIKWPFNASPRERGGAWTVFGTSPPRRWWSSLVMLFNLIKSQEDC